MIKLKKLAATGLLAVVTVFAGSALVAASGYNGNSNNNNGRGGGHYCHNNGNDNNGPWKTVELDEKQSNSQEHRGDKKGKCGDHDECKQPKAGPTTQSKGNWNNDNECPVDVCKNIEGVQETVPEGYTATDGVCTQPVVEVPVPGPTVHTETTKVVEVPVEVPVEEFQGK